MAYGDKNPWRGGTIDTSGAVRRTSPEDVDASASTGLWHSGSALRPS